MLMVISEPMREWPSDRRGALLVAAGSRAHGRAGYGDAFVV